MAVRFKLDENLPRDAEALLRGAGHDVQTVLDEHLGGNSDPRVLDACRTESRVLITFDLDFSDIRLYPPAEHSGIWLLRRHTTCSPSSILAGPEFGRAHCLLAPPVSSMRSSPSTEISRFNLRHHRAASE